MVINKNEIIVDIKKIDFNVLYKIVKLNIDKVTLKKYLIRRSQCEGSNDRETITLGNEIGELTYPVKPEIGVELSKKIGDIVKDFKIEVSGKKKKKGIIVEIIYIGTA